MNQIILSSILILALNPNPVLINRINHSTGITHTYTNSRDSTKIDLEKTTFSDMNILFIKDSAQTIESMKALFGKDYGEMMRFMQQNKLEALKFMAWYHTKQAPWQMEVAVQANAIPEILSGRIQSKIQQGGEVLIAHMQGPYEELGKAYREIENWLKENNRKAKGSPFEVYINDPGSVKSSYELRTDIYQPLEKQ
jgi:effector-binding domain-containing protein